MYRINVPLSRRHSSIPHEGEAAPARIAVVSAIRQFVMQYGTYVLVAVVVVGAGYLLYSAATDDPCGEEKEEVRAYEIVLNIPKAPNLDDQEAIDVYIRNLDYAEDRYPDLYSDYQFAVDALFRCELSQPREPLDRP